MAAFGFSRGSSKSWSVGIKESFMAAAAITVAHLRLDGEWLSFASVLTVRVVALVIRRLLDRRRPNQ